MYEYANSALPQPGSGLADLHVILALAVMGDDAALDARAARWRRWRARDVTPSGSYCLQLQRGIVAFERGDFSGGDRRARTARRESERIGGSRAQHDLIEFTLLKAYLKAGRLEEAQRLLRVRRPGASGVPVMGMAAVH
jgi:hypothetical protein